MQPALAKTLLEIIEDEPDGCANVVQFVRLTPTAKCPTYGSAGAAGLDLYADEAVEILGGDRALIKCGIAMALPAFTVGQVCSRSGLALKRGIGVLTGTFDADYRGELHVLLFNTSGKRFRVEVGDRIAQMVITPVISVRMREKLRLDTTERGAGGYGSTGLR